MKWKTANCILILNILLLTASVSAQVFYKPSDVTVRMGEALPESFFSTPHKAIDMENGEETTVILADYKDKLIILDFWATWCKPCLYSMNKLDSLQEAMAGEAFVVVPVTGQRPSEMAPAIKRYGWTAVSIVDDRTLARIFPHPGIPHQVWIRDGKVLAIPHWTSATAENIRTAIAGRSPKVPMNIVDRQLNPDMPILKPLISETKLHQKSEHSLICGKVPGLGMENLRILRKGDSTILYALNLPLSVLYYQAYKEEIFPAYTIYRGAIDWQVSDSLKSMILAPRPKLLLGNSAKEDSLFVDWENNYLYSYELRYPGEIEDSAAYAIMREDLNAFFGKFYGIKADIAPGPRIRYGVLKTLESKEKTGALLQAGLNSERGADSTVSYFSNGQYQSHLYSLMAHSSLNRATDVELDGFALVDITGLDPQLRIGIHFPKAMMQGWPLERINRELERYGLSIQIKNERPPLLAISETGVE